LDQQRREPIQVLGVVLSLILPVSINNRIIERTPATIVSSAVVSLVCEE